MKRSSGILMPLSSLPSPHGIGTFGKEAYRFADFLSRAGQKYWQLLPLGPTSYGDSPYQSFSTYAGNPYYIDLDLLVEEGLLTENEVNSYDYGNDPRHVDYGKIYESRFKILYLAYERGYKSSIHDVKAFEEENKDWICDYALFMACKKYFGMKSWLEWDDEKLRLRDEETLNKYRSELDDDIKFYTYLQYVFYKQWNRLREYVHSLGIEIIGDLPIYVSMDSADLWSESRFFQLDTHGFPIDVSGVPPDYFNENGQLWGNPLYDWDEMQNDGFGWWIRRIGGVAKLFDAIRIDHFRGFDEYWSVPATQETAKNGKWLKGPGSKLVSVLNGWFPNIRFIAEDLGYPTKGVEEMLRDSGWPGMKVLEFAFDSRDDSDYLPHAYGPHCICYSGTHDNSPLMLWKDEADPDDVKKAVRYLGLNDEEGFNWGIIRGGMSSVAELFVAQMQDYLGLGEGNRMNTPGTSVGNWQWRMLPGEIDEALTSRIYEMTLLYGRTEKKDESAQI